MPKGKQYACGCGHKEVIENATITEQAKKGADVVVVEQPETVNPIVDAECPKCGHRKAEYWEVQTRSSDEPPTRFHKCVKCKHTWREYS